MAEDFFKPALIIFCFVSLSDPLRAALLYCMMPDLCLMDSHRQNDIITVAVAAVPGITHVPSIVFCKVSVPQACLHCNQINICVEPCVGCSRHTTF